jgi:hypothetical protein
MIAWEERLAAADRLLDEMSRRIAHRGRMGWGNSLAAGMALMVCRPSASPAKVFQIASRDYNNPASHGERDDV